VIDVSQPTAPFPVSSLFLPWGGILGVAGVVVEGSYAYVAAGTAGLRIVNVSDPASPFEVAFFHTPFQAIGVAVDDGFVYLGDTNVDETGSYLRVIDVSNPLVPVEAGAFEMPFVQRVTASEGHVLAAGDFAGMYIFDGCGPLFVDGFESGDTSAWSATVP
jgi:hypothetical protein